MKYKNLENNTTIFSRREFNLFVLLTLFFLPLKIVAQSGASTVEMLVGMGFENVRWTEDDKERVFVIENSAWRLSGVGIGKAIDQIQQTGLPDKKSCKLIVLNNNVPQISLYYQPILGDSVPVVSREDWKVSYNLDESWNKVKKEKTKNSSLYKVDIVVYPELYFQNMIISQIYQGVINISPAVEISFWRGMKFSGQIICPILNDYGDMYEQVRPGFVALSQTVRLQKNWFVTASAGNFNNFRWGGDLRVVHPLKNERFSIEGRIGYTGAAYFDNWAWNYGPLKRLSWTIGGNFFWPKYNVQLSAKVEQYLLGEKGVRVDMIRHFRYTSIGFYAMKTEHASSNGGFRFQIALPPYKYKRKGYVRITPSKYFGLGYNAGNEKYYGKTYKTQPSDNIAEENSLNPYFIKSELLNY